MLAFLNRMLRADVMVLCIVLPRSILTAAMLINNETARTRIMMTILPIVTYPPVICMSAILMNLLLRNCTSNSPANIDIARITPSSVTSIQTREFPVAPLTVLKAISRLRVLILFSENSRKLIMAHIISIRLNRQNTLA